MSKQELQRQITILRNLVNTFKNPEEVRPQINYLRHLENEFDMQVALNRQ